MPSISRAAKRLEALSLLRGLLACTVLFLIQGVSAAQGLQVGDQSGLVQALLHAADEDRTADYSLTWHPFPAGPALLEAISAGAVDVGVVGNAPPVFAQAGGFAISIIGVADGAQNNNALLVPEDSGVRSVAELKGKRVAVAKGSSGHYLLLAALRQAGLSARDVDVVYVSPVDAQNAFASGHLDAWAVWYPFVGQAVARGARILLDGSAWPETGLNFTVASSQALADPQRAGQLADLLARLARAQAWATAHPVEWAQALAATTRLPLSLVQEMVSHQSLRYVPISPAVITLQQRLADAFAEAHLIPRTVPVEAIFDPRFNGALPPLH